MTPIDADPAPARPSRWKPRWITVIPIVLVGGYVSALLFVPDFRMYTQDGLAGLGLYERAYDPGCRDLVINDQGRFLWAGDRPSDHFDIGVFRLETDQLHYGLGRERFPALIKPTFIAAAAIELDASLPSLVMSPRGSEAASAAGGAGSGGGAGGGVARWPGGGARVLTVRVGDAVKIYPLDVLRRHELVNDVVGDVPIFAAYCYLADLAAVYDRRLGEHTLTYAVSGYTYHDPDVWDGRDAFVLWDRDTESLWWPPIGKAVSGPLVDTPMTVLDHALWGQTTWDEAKARYPDALVLAPHQTFRPPSSWPELAFAQPPPPAAPETSGAVAPPWGGNPD